MTASLKERPLLTPTEATDLAGIFKVLGDGTRLRIMHALVRAGELCLTALALSLDMKVPAVCNQLKRLSDLGIVTCRHVENKSYYRVVDQRVILLLEHGLSTQEP